MMRIICFCVLILFFTACDTSRVYEVNHKIPESLWSSTNTLQYQVQITDTLLPHNVYINVRNAGMYPFSNLFMFLTTRFPQGQIDRDTLEIILATPEGKWMGDGLGDIWDNRVLLKSGVRFPQAGEYVFELTQAMRMDPLPGIMDAGIRIEKSDIQDTK